MYGLVEAITVKRKNLSELPVQMVCHFVVQVSEMVQRWMNYVGR